MNMIACTDRPEAPPPPGVADEIDRLQRRVAAVGAHPLRASLDDQIRILRRTRDDPEGLFRAGDPMAAYSAALTAWEQRHLVACVDEWLDVVAQNVRDDAARPPVIDVRDYGARGDGASDDRAAIERALDAAAGIGRGAVLRFPAGRYRLGTMVDGETHLRVRGVRDVVLEGERGTEILGGRGGAIVRFDCCRNVRVRGIAFDYDPPLYSQGTVVDVAPDRRSVVWAIEPGYPLPTEPPFAGQQSIAARTVDADGRFNGGHDVRVGAWAHVTGDRWRLGTTGAGPLHADIGPGARLLLYRRYRVQAVVVTRCAWMDFESVDVWGAPEFCVFVESSTGARFHRCNIRPKPGGGGRLGGINADGFHARSNRFGPLLEQCEITRVLDDCTNFQSRMVSVNAVIDDRTLVLDVPADDADRVAMWQPGPSDFVAGDVLAFLSPDDGAFAGWGTVASVVPHEWNGHRRLCARLDRPVPGLVSRDTLGKRQPVQSPSQYLAATERGPIEHFAVNASTKSDGFVIRDCVMGGNTVTAGKIKAGNGLILNNRTYDHGWCVWSFATEMIWQEGYAARRVLVEGNRHANWFGIFIGSQYPFGRHHVGAPLNYRVDVLGNTIVGTTKGEYGIDVNGVVGCQIERNALTADRPIAVGPSASHVVVRDNRAGFGDDAR